MRPMPRRRIARQQGLVRRPVRTRMDASAELVRLEYERNKLTRQVDELKERHDQAQSELDKVAARAAWLHTFLDEANAERSAAAPEAIAVTVNIPLPGRLRTKAKARA
jgi:chromosome segregation ATPase